MTEQLEYLSLFAGIEGLGLGLGLAGMRCVGQVEIDKFCNRVLERRYPDVRRWRDVRTFGRDERPPAADVVAGGVPCQDLSVAGKRAGLGGARSGLFFEFVRIADLVAPAWVLFENVPGLLSSKQAAAETDTDEPEDALSRYHAGEDFAVVLGELTGFRPAVPVDGWRTSGLCIGPKRSAAWRVLDAQYFGVAQRRRRVFIVCHARAEVAGAVLLEREGGEGHPPPIREPREDPAAALVPGVAGTLGFHRSPRFDTDNSGAYIPEVAYAVRSSQEKQNGSPERGDVTLVAMSVDGSDVANTLKRDDGFVSEDGTGRQPGFVISQEPTILRMREGKPGGGKGPLLSDKSLTLATANDQVVFTPEVAAPITKGSFDKSHAPGRRQEDDTNLVATYIVQPTGFPKIRNALEGHQTDIAEPLVREGAGRSDRGTLAVYRKSRRAANADDAETWVPDEVANTVTPFDQGDVRATTLVRLTGDYADPTVKVEEGGLPMLAAHPMSDRVPMVIQDTTRIRKHQNGAGVSTEGVSYTLDTKGAQGVMPSTELRVRRLTVTEQERLQGFPDGWTCLEDWTAERPYSSELCTCPDGPRVAAIGNAVAVPVAAWIGRRLVERS